MPEILFSYGKEYAFILGPDDFPALQALLERSADYFYLVEGQPPRPDEATNLAKDCPPGWTTADKLLIGITDQENSLLAVIDGMCGYPKEGIFWIGLMLVDPSKRGRGLGTRILAGFENWAASQGAKQIRLGVVEENVKALRFWQRSGYKLHSKSDPTPMGQKKHVIFRLKKKI
jgi:GNAT superfamily N-acetyltransferase